MFRGYLDWFSIKELLEMHTRLRLSEFFNKHAMFGLSLWSL